MFGNLLRPSGREFRCTPSHFEKMAGRQEWPLKSPCATGLRRATARLHRRALGDGYAIHRDVFSRGIPPMYTPEKETTHPEQERAADVAAEETNLNSNDTQPASKLLAEANRVIATFPSVMTRKSKHQAESRVLCLFLAALAASREEQAV
jgi:hypothetical protein